MQMDSYGGMLAAWFRFKYPNLVVGALASSAPLKIPANLMGPYAFFGHVTEVRRANQDIPLILFFGGGGGADKFFLLSSLLTLHQS